MRARLMVFVVASASCLAACSSTSSPPRAAPQLSWAAGSTSATNGTASPLDVTSVCGSSTDTFLAELMHHSPTQLKVMQEWGDVAPGGRQLLISGSVTTFHQGPGDLPIDHPLGDDLSMDVKLDAPFTSFSQKLGEAPSDTKPGEMHVEISSGLIPHVARPATASPAQTWQQLSEHNLTGFQPGFAHPAIGDRVLVGGRYLVDCGHPDFHTELHPISFLAWSHQEGSGTVVHFYENAYRDTEYYSPDPSVLGSVNDSARLSDPQTARFPPRLINEVAGVLSGKIQRLDAFELVQTIRPTDGSWQACLPSGTPGSWLKVNYDIRTGPGVDATVRPQSSTGCADIAITGSSSYTSPDLAVRTCAMPWNYINRITSQALAASVNAQQLIQNFVPQSKWPIIDLDPLVGCADALSGPTLSAVPSGRLSRAGAAQPFPVYGVITLTPS